MSRTIDHGFRQAVYSHNKRDVQLILENIVYMELIRRGYEVTIGNVGKKEIDFVAKKMEQKDISKYLMKLTRKAHVIENLIRY